MLIAFFVFCAVVAVVVYLVAVGGVRRPSLPGESRANHRLTIAILVVAFAFTLVVPAIVLDKNGTSQAHTAAGVHLTSAQVKGRELFSTSCAVCHTLGAVKSVGRIGPVLDVRVAEEPTFAARKALVLSAISEGRARGNGNMPAKLYEGREAEDIAQFVAAVAGHS